MVLQGIVQVYNKKVKLLGPIDLTSILRKYSHAPDKDVSVNDGQNIRRWSHNIIIYYNIYHCVTIVYSIQYSIMLYRFVT